MDSTCVSAAPTPALAAWPGERYSSMIVLAQKMTPKIVKTGHSKVYAQLRALPPSARWNCQSPSHSMPHAASTANACHASHRGVIRKNHRGRGFTLDML